MDHWLLGSDRLLDIPCSDVDIALSTMTGEQLGNILTTVLSSLRMMNDTNKERPRIYGAGNCENASRTMADLYGRPF